MLDQITPVILTYNESPNIGRTLARLDWARDVVVVDSFSDDDTVAIANSFSKVRVYQRRFDTFAAQWTFGVMETEIATEWILGIDADFLLTDELITEIAGITPAATTHAYNVPLKYCIGGKELRLSLLAPLPMIYRRRGTTFTADAHTYRVEVAGDIRTLQAPVLHDDRKSLRHWIQAQSGYAQLEAAKLIATPQTELDLPDRIRRLRVIAPLMIFCYCLAKGGLLDGYAGLYYAMQRAVFELILSLYLIEHDLGMSNIPRTSAATIAARAAAKNCDRSADPV